MPGMCFLGAFRFVPQDIKNKILSYGSPGPQLCLLWRLPPSPPALHLPAPPLALDPSRAPAALVIKPQSLIGSRLVAVLPGFAAPGQSHSPALLLSALFIRTSFPKEEVGLCSPESCVFSFCVHIAVITHLSLWLFNNLITEPRVSQLLEPHYRGSSPRFTTC